MTIHSPRIGNLQLASRFTLAPLAGYTNLPFRLCVRDIGGIGLATTDLVNARAILQNSKRTMELLASHPDDRPWAVQLYGSEPEFMVPAAEYLVERGATVIDINMGCPVRKVVKTGGGSALMCNPKAGIGMVAQIVEAVDVPVTVKMRLGWDSLNITSPYFAREFEKVGVQAITVHGRTRAQGFGGEVDLDGIKATVEATHDIPVFGNGDVRNVAEAERMILHTGCDGIAIGRGALANPWLFRQLNRWLETGDPGPGGTYEERIEFMSRHLRRLCDWRGERHGCVNFRKVGTWYSKSLRTGKPIQQKFVLLESISQFDRIVEYLRERGAPPGWERLNAAGDVPVPKGPNAHW